MATRCYTSSTATPAISPAFHSGWEDTASAIRRTSRRDKANSALTNFGVAEVSATEVDVLVVQRVMGPFGPHNYTGATFKGQNAVLESNDAADMRAQVVVRVANTSGTIIAELLGFDVGALANEWVTTAAGINRTFPRGGAAALDALDNSDITVDHYLVVEEGYHSHNTSTASRTGTFRIGDDNSHTDLPEDETTGGNSRRGWFEISHNLPMVTTDAYEEELRDLGVHVYWPTDESSGSVKDRMLRVDLPAVGTPSYGVTPPIAGWGAVGMLDTDKFDAFSDTSPTNAVYAGPGSVVGWAKAGATDQVHGEAAIFWHGPTDTEGSGGFQQFQVGGSWHILSYLNDTPSQSNINGLNADTVWHFFAATFGPTGGVRYYTEVAGVVTLQGSATNADQIFTETYILGGSEAAAAGIWDVSRPAFFRVELSEAQIQDLYDTTVVGAASFVGLIIGSPPYVAP